MKRRILKKAIAGILSAAICLSILTGCSNANIKDPDKTMDAFYQLMIYQKTKAMSNLGIDKEESGETLKEYRSSMISTFQDSFSSAGVSITRQQASDIFDAVSKKFAQLDYKVTIVKEDNKEAEVKVSSQYIDYLKIFKDAKTATVNELKPQHIEKLSDAKKQLVANIIEGFENAEISTDMHSKTFSLKLQKIKSGKNTIKLFFPKNAEQTGADFIKLVTNQ